MLQLQLWAVTWAKGVDSVHYSKQAAKDRAKELEDNQLAGGNPYPCVRVELAKLQYMTTPITAALSFLFQSKKNRRETKRELSTQDKKELKKINEMGMFEAMDYLAKK